MNRWLMVISCIACLWACNTHIKEAVVKGKVTNALGSRLYVEICGQDSLLQTRLDSTGHFSFEFSLSDGAYVRLVNGKAALPLYVTPGMIINLEMDAQKLREGDYASIVFNEGLNGETQMMLDFYSKQWFPSSQEMFVCSPAEFKHLISQVVRYNDSIIDAFGVESGTACDPLFVKLFKYQVKVPFAMSYFYYPMYHSLLVKQDTAAVPDNFNIFDNTLPKNDSLVYNKVYRYKTYEVAYWNDRISTAMLNEQVPDSNVVATYFEKLSALQLLPQISMDVAQAFFSQQVEGLSLDEKALVEKYINVLKD